MFSSSSRGFSSPLLTTIMAVVAVTPTVRRLCKMCIVSCHLHNPVGKGVIIPPVLVGFLKLSEGG